MRGSNRQRTRQNRRTVQQCRLRLVRERRGSEPGRRAIPIRSELIRPGQVDPAYRAAHAEAGRNGITNTSSVGGKIYTPLGAWYHATKHALEGWSDCLRIELRPFGINVVIIEPGIIETWFGDVIGQPMLRN